MRPDEIDYLPAGLLRVGGKPFQEASDMNGTMKFDRSKWLRTREALGRCGLHLPEDAHPGDLNMFLDLLYTAAVAKGGLEQDRDGVREAEGADGYTSAVGMSLAERNELQKQVAVLERQAVRLSQAEDAPMDDATKRELFRLRALLARPTREEVAAGDQLCKLVGRISPAEAERRQRA